MIWYSYSFHALNELYVNRFRPFPWQHDARKVFERQGVEVRELLLSVGGSTKTNKPRLLEASLAVSIRPILVPSKLHLKLLI